MGARLLVFGFLLVGFLFVFGLWGEGRPDNSIIFSGFTVTGSISVFARFFGLNRLLLVRNQVHNLHPTLFISFLNFLRLGPMNVLPMSCSEHFWATKAGQGQGANILRGRVGEVDGLRRLEVGISKLMGEHLERIGQHLRRLTSWPQTVIAIRAVHLGVTMAVARGWRGRHCISCRKIIIEK